MKLFKYILISIISIISIAILVGSIFFIKDYFDKTKKYNEYKAKVETTIDDNNSLTEKNKILLITNEQYEQDKIDLQKQIDDKKVIIVEKEKIVYKDGVLIIPSDYDSLKFNYSTLSNLYADRGTILIALEEKDKINEKQITDLSKALADSNTQLGICNDLLKNNVEKPVPFFKQGLLLGIGVDIDQIISYSGGYLITIKDKLYTEFILSYPPQCQVLFGVKL